MTVPKIQMSSEPYCYGQFTEGKASKHFGRSHVHWLTGTASTVMVGCVEGESSGFALILKDFDCLLLCQKAGNTLRLRKFSVENSFISL